MNLEKLINYKIWADNIYLEYCESLSEEQLQKEIDNYKKSIRDILVHIAEVHWSWFETITTKNYDNPPLFEDMKKDDLIALIKNQNKVVLEYVSKNDLKKEITLQWSKTDKPVRTSDWNIIFNFITHNAYHRGQIAIFLRILGVEIIQETDFNPYLYELGQ